jgi:hypothetical protein
MDDFFIKLNVGFPFEDKMEPDLHAWPHPFSQMAGNTWIFICLWEIRMSSLFTVIAVVGTAARKIGYQHPNLDLLYVAIGLGRIWVRSAKPEVGH